MTPQKKVIFIGGSAFSGSTLLDMTLANSPNGFSCGEVNALFYPFRKHHFDYVCGCGDKQCQIWKQVKIRGPDNLYNSIFELFPEVDFIVDSSKDPLWIKKRIDDLSGSDIAVYNILIWKTPQEFFASRSKRCMIKGWQRTWVNYYRLYFTLIDQWNAVRYKDFVQSQEALKNLCGQLRIPYFDGKEKYWETVHHTLFGNTSTKIHLYSQGSNNYTDSQKELHDTTVRSGSAGDQNKQHYRKIYYEKYSEKDLGQIDIKCNVRLLMRDIEELLDEKDILRRPHKNLTLKNDLTMPLYFVLFHQMKRVLNRLSIRLF